MPLVSCGTKGPSGVRNVSGWLCSKCSRVLSRRDALREHSIRKHGWCIDTNAPATQEALNALKQKTQRRKPCRPDSADATKIKIHRQEPPASTISPPWVCPVCDDTFMDQALLTAHQKMHTAGEIFGEISDDSLSDVECIDLATDEMHQPSKQQSDVEPDDPPAASLQSKVPSKLTENKSGNLTGQDKRTALTKWTPFPMAVLETTKANPCERKKFELKMPPCSIKQSSVSSELKVVPKQKAENPLPSASTVAHAHLQTLFEYTKMWPARGALPSVRDIVAFRNTVPLDTTPTEVGQLTGMKFGWQGAETVTSEQYVQGVVAGHDYARRALLDELWKNLKTKPTSTSEALQQCEWLAEWLESQPRPPTPKQLFDD